MADLADMIMGDEYNLKSFSRAIREGRLVETLRKTGPYTVFAPVDDAFAKLSATQLDALFANKAKLQALVTYHVVPKKLSIADMRNLNTERLATLQGQSIALDSHRWHLHLNPKVNGANITDRHNVDANNGLLHEIDSVMMPNFDLTCSICGQGFLTHDDLIAHTKTAHNDAPKAASIKTPMVAMDEKHIELGRVTNIEIEKQPVELETPPVIPVPAVVAPITPAPTHPIVAPHATNQPAIHEHTPKPVASTKKPHMTEFDVHYIDDSQEYVYHLKTSSGEIIGESPYFKTLAQLNKNLTQVKTNAPLASILCPEPSKMNSKADHTGIIAGPVFEQFKDSNGKWRFNLKESTDGTILLSSRKAYDSLYACNNGISLLKTDAKVAKTSYPSRHKQSLQIS